MAEIQTVGVVGAGTMGSGIAHVFARAGFRVLLCDVEQRFLDRALKQIRANLGREAVKGKLAEAEIEPALARIQPTLDREVLGASELVVEAASERFELKAELFASLDRILPQGAILATNTSSMSITKLAARTRRPQQVIGMHFFNPVPVMA
ncbi:MAG TPA: 3-hydroxyacyl-CoA dehydrogenase NAD-binding domain-containing protein, partial [Terracidiphilus sp.]|nr:3-hydroxyacyl-CoA dehydrogenase NAD-binding domain-containing protein [Terracidiphilus sp.]